MSTWNWDLMQLIAAIAAAWIGAGLCAGGLGFASMQKGYPRNARDNYFVDLHVIFGGGILLGPIGLIFALTQLMSGRWQYHGMLFPGSWTPEDAKQLQDETRHGQ